MAPNHRNNPKFQKRFELELQLFCRKSHTDKLDFLFPTTVNHIAGLQMYRPYHQYSHYCFLSRLIFFSVVGTWAPWNCIQTKDCVTGLTQENKKQYSNFNLQRIHTSLNIILWRVLQWPDIYPWRCSIIKIFAGLGDIMNNNLDIENTNQS